MESVMEKKFFGKRKFTNKRKAGCFSPADIFEARKIWASSECLNPYNAEPAYEHMNTHFNKALINNGRII
jgi:hypothetical protein